MNQQAEWTTRNDRPAHLPRHGRPRRWLVLILILIAISSAIRAEDKHDGELGFVVFVRGEARILKGDTVATAAADMALSVQDIIETGAGAALRFVFKHDKKSGTRNVRANQRFEMKQILSEPAASSSVDVQKAIVDTFFTPSNDGEIAGVVRSEQKTLAILFPRSRVRGPIRRVVWTPNPDAEAYRVVVKADSREVFNAIGTGTFMNIPEVLMSSHPTFEVQALADEEIIDKAESTPLLLPVDEQKSLDDTLQSLLPEDGASDDGASLLAGIALQQHGCHGEALTRFADYLRIVPESKRGRALAERSWQGLNVGSSLETVLRDLGSEPKVSGTSAP